MLWVHLGLSAPPRSPCWGQLRVFLAWSPGQGRTQSLLPGRKSCGVAEPLEKGAVPSPSCARSRAG